MKTTIHIENLEISAIIGILDFERIQTQKIIVDATIVYFYKEKNFINYADIIQLIETLIIEKKYELLEEALVNIQEKIITLYHEIIELNIKISKPEIIRNANVALSLNWLGKNED